jgi:hypothetical protein
MSLSPQIAAVVSDAPEAASFPRDVALEDGEHRLTLTLTAAGPVGVAFEHLRFETHGRPERSVPALRARGDELAARLTYLMEPLVPLELDEAAGTLALRSRQPTGRGALRSYYEVRLDRTGTATLTRIAFDDATRRRRPVPCQMTVEVLERLADDLAATAG